MNNQNQNIVTRPVFIHKSTTNKSFLDMHYFLKERGIKNNDFFLALLDSGLAGVDPRDPNLPPYMKARILKECQLNYWYFIREIVRIPQQGGAVGSGVRYQLNRGNLALNFLFILNFDVFFIMPRQFGKTIGAACRYLWCYQFGTSNSEMMFFHKDASGSKDNLKSLRAIRDSLPTYLQMSSAVNQEGKKLKVPNTVVMMQHPFNNNRIVTKPSARTKEAANNLGRGATIPLIYFDEFAFMPWNEEVLMAAAPAYSRASENAARVGAPHGMLITTTPGDLLTSAGSYAFDIRNKATPWREEYYDYTYDQLLGLRNSNKQSSFFLVEYTYQQLGRGQDYLNKMIVEMQSNWPKIRREVLLEWAESPTECPFSQEDLDVIKQFTRQPIRTLYFGQFGQYAMDIYEDIDLAYPPIIGVDVSGATFNDSSAITIIDSHTTRVCANLHCNFIPADDLADVVYQIVTKYMPSAIVSVERNGGFGAAVVQRLVKTSVKKNLYWEIKDKVIEETFNGVRMEKTPRKVKVYGVDSTKNVRARLIEILIERSMYHKDKFIAPVLWEEMRAMEVKKSGKVEHSDKTHDDNVFSYLMALYVWYEGKNLVENFGIRKSTLRTDDNQEMEEAEFEEALEAREKVDFRSAEFETNPDIAEELERLESDKFITSEDLKTQEYLRNISNRNIVIGNINKSDDELDFGVTIHSVTNPQYPGFTKLPTSIYDGDYDDLFDGINDRNSVLSGNLADFYNKI